MPKRYAFFVDTSRCMGCFTCAMACRNYYQPPVGVIWRNVHPLSPAIYPHNERAFLSLACNHCYDPACFNACPADAYSIRPDGIVVHHRDRCIGCQNCIRACPFGAPQFNPEIKKVEKCNFCFERIDAGFKPVCVHSCPVQALQIVNVEEFDAPDAVQYPPGFPVMPAVNPSTRFILPKMPQMVRR